MNMVEAKKSKVVGSVVVTANITQEHVDDILCAAFEGGISYWAPENVKVIGKWPKGANFSSDVISRGGKIYIYDVEANKNHILSLENVVNGFNLYCNKHHLTPEEVHENHDAGVADEIVQFAIFKEVIYG